MEKNIFIILLEVGAGILILVFLFAFLLPFIVPFLVPITGLIPLIVGAVVIIFAFVGAGWMADYVSK